MRLTHLSLSNFRNFSRLDANVPGGPVLLVGNNAQGKTSLLEAVYFLATLDSFQASSDRQLINFLAVEAAQKAAEKQVASESQESKAVTRIIASFERGGRTQTLEVRIIQECAPGNGANGPAYVHKDVLFNGVKLKAHEAAGKFTAVLFLPQMLAVIEGSPEERRRYLNQALSQVSSTYPAALSEYQRVLTQRNALLKQIAERQGDPDQLDFWDDALTTPGALLMQARLAAIQELEYLAVAVHSDLTNQAEILRLNYQPAYHPPAKPNDAQITLPLGAARENGALTADNIKNGFLRRLQETRSEEIARGLTLTGPHRDELRILSNGIDLGHYGSRGQVRTAMLSLKLAEVEWMRAKTGQWPVLLLDEVLAELDTQRRNDLLSRLAGAEQALLTTTDLDLFPSDFVQKTSLWRIQAGRLVNAR